MAAPGSGGGDAGAVDDWEADRTRLTEGGQPR